MELFPSLKSPRAAAWLQVCSFSAFVKFQDLDGSQENKLQFLSNKMLNNSNNRNQTLNMNTFKSVNVVLIKRGEPELT